MPSRLAMRRNGGGPRGNGGGHSRAPLGWLLKSRRSCRTGSVSPGARDSEGAKLESIWVAPIYRHQGVCRDLVLALADRERRMGATRLLLWVLDGNHGRAARVRGARLPADGETQFCGVRAMGVSASSANQLLNPTYANRWFAESRPWSKFSAPRNPSLPGAS
jgi:GNAT superfamily N-acetyltransferase